MKNTTEEQEVLKDMMKNINSVEELYKMVSILCDTNMTSEEIGSLIKGVAIPKEETKEEEKELSRK